MYKNFSTHDRVRWQIDCDNTIREKENVILSSPTGSGKTERYENWALNKPERPIFITSPIKALSNQKFRELQASGYKVGLETGDIRYIPHEDCDIICCTQEIYNNKYRHYKNSTLVIDELSYIFEEEERTRAYIDSLQYSEAKNIMICSATFGNPEEIKKYIDKVTNRDFFLYVNKDRLTTLEYKGELPKNYIRDSLVVAYSKKNCEIIANSIYRDRINKILNFNLSNNNYDPRTRNKKEILELAKKYNVHNEELIELATIGVAYYYGSLYPKEKLFIEELFEKRLIDTVVGTDALALGVNFPIKNVVFAELWKNNKYFNGPISKNLFEQLSGRAGRKGFFDNGYVYYCDDFTEELNKHERKSSNQKSLKELFYELVNAQNEEIKISLNANIKELLMGNTTIEEEAWFITKYSTDSKNYEVEEKKIRKIINYIAYFDVASYYLSKRFPNLDFSRGYSQNSENYSLKLKNKIESLTNSLTKLQTYFNRDIGEVYLTEYSPEQNCTIFVDVLMETPIDILIRKYGKRFRDLLLLRKYMYKLPEKYSKNYDLSLIDKKIDNLDYTVLHPNEFKINKVFEVVKKEFIPKKKNKNKKTNSCPSYFDIILIDGKEYIKILTENNNMLVCDYSEEGNLKLYYISSNINYRVTGLISGKQGLKLLNKLDINSLIYQTDIDKIEGIKLSLKNKHEIK